MYRCVVCERAYEEMPTRMTCKDQSCGGLVEEAKED